MKRPPANPCSIPPRRAMPPHAEEQSDADALEPGAVATEILAAVETKVSATNVTLDSGRRYELLSGEIADSMVVRSASGHVLLRVSVGDRGPLLSFESAEVTLSARHRLAITAPEVALVAGELAIDATELTTSCTHRRELVRENRHCRVLGEERLEASKVSVQANDGDVSLRAMERVAIDGDHVGLNDMPCPTPFPWSRLCEEGRR